MEDLLKTPGHSISEKVQRLVYSYSSDLIHGVSQGEILTLKHFLVGPGIHNLTGQKLPIKILSNLGHSADYKTVCQLETAQAEVAQLLYDQGTSSGLKPSSNDTYVFTYFWADNFNKKIECDKTGMINSTHMVKFQEHSEDCLMQKPVRSLLRKTTTFAVRNTGEVREVRVDMKIEPAKLIPLAVQDMEGNQNFIELEMQYFLRVLLHMIRSDQSLFPTFSGWELLIRKTRAILALKKTVVTYLPPINAPVTSFSTIFSYLQYMQKLCREVNMPFVNVTLGLGAAMNAYRVVWSYPEIFSNVIIHLGDFHLMKEIFQILGMLIEGSGFEEIVFQSGLSTSGSLNSILSGSHYNRCWNIHAHFSEALERLLLEHFLVDQSCDIQQKITNSQISSAVDGMIGDLAANSDVKDLQQLFKRYKEEVRAGKHGKTAQFWQVNYLDIIHILNGIHIAVQESNYELRLKCWKEILPYFFCLNRTNYSRYGSYYVSQLPKIDELFPGCKERLKYYGISVQGQDRYPNSCGSKRRTNT